MVDLKVYFGSTHALSGPAARDAVFANMALDNVQSGINRQQMGKLNR